MTSSHLSNTITDRIAKVRQQLPETVRLIAVSKQVSVEAIREAYTAGIRDFGESRVQEAAVKQSQLQDLPEGEISTLFQNTRSLAGKIQQQNWSNIKMEHLSMGMSDDYHLAVPAGATMVRLGRTVFGERF